MRRDIFAHLQLRNIVLIEGRQSLYPVESVLLKLGPWFLQFFGECGTGYCVACMIVVRYQLVSEHMRIRS